MAPDLTWEAPSACPEGSTVEARVDELLRGSSASGSSLHAEARVEPLAAGWRLRVVLRDDRRGVAERRELAAPDCAALAEAFALIVAVHVDALQTDFNAVALQRPRTPPWPTAVAPSAPVVPPAPRTASPRPRRVVSPEPRPPTATATRSLGALLRLEGGAELGILPGVAGGAGLMGGIAGRAWRVELGASGWPARTASAASLGVRLDLVVGRARVCWAPAIGRWHVPVCGGGEAGGLRGVGTTGVTRPIPRWAPWGAATASVGAAWSLRPWIGPYAAVESVAVLSRARFSVGEQTVVRAEAVGIRAWIGLELKFASRRGAAGQTPRRAPEP